MKKWLISFLLLTSLFFVGISSSKAYISEVHYNYEEMYNNLTTEQINFLNDAISMLNSTAYHYTITIDSFNSNGCSTGSISQTDYNNYCTPSNAPITKFRLRIFNPEFYSQNSFLGFAVSSGNTRDTVATFGLLTGTYLNENMGYFLESSNLSDYGVNNNLGFSADINATNYRDVINGFLSNPTYNFGYISAKRIGYSNSTTNGVPFNITYVPYMIYKNFNIPLVNVILNTGIGQLTYINNQTYIDYDGESTKYSHTDSDFPFLLNFIESKQNFTNVKKMGKSQFGITSNDITYYGGLTTPSSINCPNYREFKNNFCYLYGTDFDDGSFNYFDVRLKLGSNGKYIIPITDDNYYILTIRYDNLYNISPNYVRYYDSIGQALHTSEVEEYNVVDNGLYKDMQIVFKVDVSTSNTYFEYLEVNFDNLSDYDINVSDFNFGIYNVYKLTNYGTTFPTFTDLSNDYNKNTINSIENGSSSDDNFFTNFSLNNYGLGSIITAPLRIYNAMKVTDTCTPLVIPFPNSNQSITIPCIRDVIEQNFGLLFTILQTILSGLICYKICVNWFSTIKNMQTPKTDSIEVVDL